MFDVLLALGANLGNRETTIRLAWEEIASLPETETVQISRFYETKPVGGPQGQADYINAAGTIRTALPPQELLERLQNIEYRFGRLRCEHWGPRTLDIDILLYDTEVVETPELRIPHPEMLHREFVLLPALDVASGWIHPGCGLSLLDVWKQQKIKNKSLQ